MELPDRVTELPPICARCAAELTPGEGNFFLVRIEAIADPTPPTFSQQELDANNRQEMEKLLAEMEHLSAQEALDQVYRRMFLHLCNRCYGEWIENPAG